MRARVYAAVGACDSDDWIAMLALALIGGGLAHWSVAVAAIVVGVILLALVASPAVRDGSQR